MMGSQGIPKHNNYKEILKDAHQGDWDNRKREVDREVGGKVGGAWHAPVVLLLTCS
jgi:hypothetical protein